MNDLTYETEDGAVKIRPRYSDALGQWLMFVGMHDEDRWVIFDSVEEITPETIDELTTGMKPRRLRRLAIFIGEPWSIIDPAPRAIADAQRDLLHAMNERVYRNLMTVDEAVIRERRKQEERDVQDGSMN